MSRPGFAAAIGELRTVPGYHWSGLGQAVKAAAALDEAGLIKYCSRLPQKCDRSNEIELFDNREWNRNVRGELVVARGLQGPWSRVQALYNSMIRTRCPRDSVRQLFDHVSSDKSLGEFDPGSGRTLAACLTHASQGGSGQLGQPANGCVTREQPALVWGIAGLTPG